VVAQLEARIVVRVHLPQPPAEAEHAAVQVVAALVRADAAGLAIEGERGTADAVAEAPDHDALVGRVGEVRRGIGQAQHQRHRSLRTGELQPRQDATQVQHLGPQRAAPAEHVRVHYAAVVEPAERSPLCHPSSLSPATAGRAAG